MWNLSSTIDVIILWRKDIISRTWKEYYRHFEFHYRRNGFVRLDNYYLEMQNICDTLTSTILCNCSQIFAENEQYNGWI